MKENDIYSELSTIRSLMERSTKFISLSGLSGIMAGIYALIGAFAGYRIVYGAEGGLENRLYALHNDTALIKLVVIALLVLAFSLATGVFLTIRQAQKKGEKSWNPVSRRLMTSLSIPLITGGLLILIMLYREQYETIASACLIFYGLGLVAGSNYTFSDVKWLGFCEIGLGLLAALVPGYGLVFWTIGFGLLHILYGSIMHFKYNQ
jgi:hypothetical protein